MIFLRQRFGCFAIRRHARGEAQPRATARRQSHTLSETHNRIEDDSGCARQRAVECRRVGGTAAAAQKTRAVGLPFDGALRTAVEAQGVKRPGGRLARIAWTPMTQERGAVRQVFRFDEQLTECRMREVVRRRGEDDFCITCHVDLAKARAVIPYGDAAYLD